MKTLYFFFALLLLTSCSDYREIDPREFNMHIATRSDIETPEELITIFYDYPESEGKPTLDISTEEENGIYTITLINNYVQDDSVCGEKLMIRAKKNGLSWHVYEIKENHRCCDDRGNGNWGTGSCN